MFFYCTPHIREGKKEKNVFRTDHQKWVVVVVDVAAAFADVRGVAVR